MSKGFQNDVLIVLIVLTASVMPSLPELIGHVQGEDPSMKRIAVIPVVLLVLLLLLAYSLNEKGVSAVL